MASAPPDLSQLLVIEGVAEILNVSGKTVRREIDAGELVAVRVGNQLRVTPDDLRDYIRRRRTVRTRPESRTKPRLPKSS